MTIHEILKTYWGYDSFRPLQQEIVESVIAGKDTLALLPTGGGKSICFQVPAMTFEGLCLVVSPLIALMKDQVENLEKAGIRAHAIYSGLHFHEIELILNNCVNGGVKFLYVSPERLSSGLLRDYLIQMKIGLIAIDEAHCISQWGFDFRPEYRKIIETRSLLPDVPLIALTATATSKVVVDIQEQLGFKQKNVFRKSFERLNLHYIVRTQENKLEKLLNSIALTKGSGLVYVRNRKLTEEIAAFLVDNKVNASYYHAGLGPELRQKRQEDWIRNKTRIMVCTNAFGMGIDKPDCRLVIHYEMPDCLEAYYQEAGRAGRNNKSAFCMLLFHPSDAEIMRAKLARNFPEESVLRSVYEAICSYLFMPVGSSSQDGFDFDIGVFSEQYRRNPIEVLNAVKLLSQLDILHINEAFHQPSRIRIMMPGNQLYAFLVDHIQFDELIKILLRSYGGIFDNYISISEKNLAMKLNCTEKDLKEKLFKLHQLGVIEYLVQKNSPQLFIHGERVKTEYLKLNSAWIRQRKETEENKLEEMISYAENGLKCRSRVLLSYFDEHNALDCGACDICKEKLKEAWPEEKMLELMHKLEKLNWQDKRTVKQLVKEIKGFREEELAGAFRILIDKGILQLDTQQLLVWTKRN